MRPRLWATALIIVPVLIIVGMRLAPGSPDSPALQETVTTPTVVTSVPVAAPPSSASSSSPDPRVGSVRATAVAFMAGWLNVDPAGRVAALRRTATPELAQALAGTDRRHIPSAHLVGSPKVNSLAPDNTSATVWVVLSNGDAIALELIGDPSGPQGWRVADVAPR